uniref:Thrombospondin type 1 domain-containing protein n=1 Tax=Wuchereria bancrofti TaxID=6293 RepID=A0AAF5PJC6_WUCBA
MQSFLQSKFVTTTSPLGSYCIGSSFGQRSCIPKRACIGTPVNGKWTPWSEWSQCSDPCVNGHRSRTRFCSNPRPSEGGFQCTGSDFEITSCDDISRCFHCRFWTKNVASFQSVQ